ncbi:2%2C5-diketo-D-gluconic acid reductase A [uncultured Roseburia sp.]|uniref:Aldo/keto reductase n=1 Tax=Brotonthovivens ammoniilytica TaxID=2981725 RepID=A0ABT2TH99_9FIRM|nr:aldo/keto reductase [Brotonthovivens ammoniilytica]MCU6761550.1 aldo/keto reductase [Brotonthovivens ammoniilytica]SCI31620.1 2%2C5-diketo-D-gluconic acid reductase A [uncultured Roseburia sp.]
MLKVKLNNGIEMPILGFGTFLTGGTDCEQSVCTAIQNGYRLIDTAEAYGNEEQVGNGIRKSGVDRKELFIVTKVNFKSYEATRETVLQSLEKLGTDYLDLVLLHWPFGNYYKAWRELEALYAERKIKAIGVSNFEPDRLIDLIHFNKVVPAVNQIETNLHCQRKTEHGWMKKYNVQHMAYAPLGQGNRNEMFSQAEVMALAEKYKKAPAQIMLRFLTQQDVVVIPKSIHEERIKENFDIFDFNLTDEELETLTAIDTNTAKIGNAEQPEMVEFAMTW